MLETEEAEKSLHLYVQAGTPVRESPSGAHLPKNPLAHVCSTRMAMSRRICRHGVRW